MSSNSAPSPASTQESASSLFPPKAASETRRRPPASAALAPQARRPSRSPSPEAAAADAHAPVSTPVKADPRAASHRTPARTSPPSASRAHRTAPAAAERAPGAAQAAKDLFGADPAVGNQAAEGACPAEGDEAGDDAQCEQPCDQVADDPRHPAVRRRSSHELPSRKDLFGIAILVAIAVLSFALISLMGGSSGPAQRSANQGMGDSSGSRVSVFINATEEHADTTASSLIIRMSRHGSPVDSVTGRLIAQDSRIRSPTAVTPYFTGVTDVLFSEAKRELIAFEAHCIGDANATTVFPPELSRLNSSRPWYARHLMEQHTGVKPDNCSSAMWLLAGTIANRTCVDSIVSTVLRSYCDDDGVCSFLSRAPAVLGKMSSFRKETVDRRGTEPNFRGTDNLEYLHNEISASIVDSDCADYGTNQKCKLALNGLKYRNRASISDDQVSSRIALAKFYLLSQASRITYAQSIWALHDVIKHTAHLNPVNCDALTESVVSDPNDEEGAFFERNNKMFY